MTVSPSGYRVPLALTVALLFFLTGAPTSILAQGRTLKVDDLRLEVGVSTPALSPDGSQAIVATSTPNYEENRFDRTLILIDIATGDQRELTPHRPGVGQPRWSPSGDRIAFTDSGEGGSCSAPTIVAVVLRERHSRAR